MDRPRISELTKGYRHPAGVSEALAARKAQLDAAVDLQARECPHGHGLMVMRPLEQQTYEQLFCGLWWDCKNGCTSNYCEYSRDLAYTHGMPYRNGKAWEKWDGTGWTAIPPMTAEAFWAELRAWDEAQQPKRRPARRKRAAA